MDESSTGSSSIPVGPAGVTTNSRKQLEGSSHRFGIVKKNSTRNYESSRRDLKESASGEVMRLSVSVLLDNKRPQILDEDNFLGRDNIRWTEAEKEVIEGLVKAAMGFNDTRGDSIFVGNMPFEKRRNRTKRLKSNRPGSGTSSSWTLCVMFPGIAIVALIMLVIRPMVQRLPPSLQISIC